MGEGCVIIYSSCHAPNPNHLLNELNLFFNYTGTAGRLHRMKLVPVSPQPSHNVHSQANGRQITTERRNLSTQLVCSLGPTPLCACKPNRLDKGTAKITTIFLQQRMHFETWLKEGSDHMLRLHFKNHDFCEHSYSEQRRLCGHISQLHGFCTGATLCHRIQLDKLYVWAVTFPPCKHSTAIIQQIEVGYK